MKKKDKFLTVFVLVMICGVIGVAIALLISYCSGNKTLFDTTYTYDKAIISLQNGVIVEGNITEWCDYESDQLQITMESGDIYLCHAENVTLIHTAN